MLALEPADPSPAAAHGAPRPPRSGRTLRPGGSLFDCPERSHLQWPSTIFTLIESCKGAYVELVPYLSDVLGRVATHLASRIDELTPAQWRTVDVVATVG